MKQQITPCSCCGTALVYNDGEYPHNINIKATCDKLIKRCNNGEMSIIRGDCPLEMMEALLEADTVYSIVQFLQCNICKNTIFWGLCIRGAPNYKVVSKEEVYTWPWEDKRKYWLKNY